MSDKDGDLRFETTSIYGATTRRGLVEVKCGQQSMTVTPAKAREMATFLLESAGAAEGDEALMKVLERDGISPQRAAQFLVAHRQERAILEERARREMREAIAHDQDNPGATP